jgi:hypothetical protein
MLPLSRPPTREALLPTPVDVSHFVIGPTHESGVGVPFIALSQITKKQSGVMANLMPVVASPTPAATKRIHAPGGLCTRWFPQMGPHG